MINSIYQLVSPKVFTIKYEDISIKDQIIVKPCYLALCHADQRYYQGKRDKKVLAKKLPMALIHECCGKVIFDPTGTFEAGQSVCLMPNVAGEGPDYIYPNYQKGSKFLSSGYDGFMREYVAIDKEQIVKIPNDVPMNIAAITEFVTVACHALNRFERISHENRGRIGIWGDGSLAFTLATVMRYKYPDMHITVLGKDPQKLSMFSFVDETLFIDEIPEDFKIDHAFECVGNAVSGDAIDDIIKYIKPQGSVMLMGVSETPVPVFTRNVLEKGLTLVGCSRSNRGDFEDAANIIADKNVQDRLSLIITEELSVKNISDIHTAFAIDQNNPFKTVMKWDI